MPPTLPTMPPSGTAVPRAYGDQIEAAQIQIDVIPVSFEAGETTTAPILCPVRTTILGFYASVIKALAITDAGTIALVDNLGATQQTISFPAASALTTESTQNPPGGIEIPAGAFYRLTWAKATSGGKALVTITKRVHP